MSKLTSKIKLGLWSIIYGPYYAYKYWSCQKDRVKFHILNSEQSVKYIVDNKLSVCRFGDGEFAMVYHFCDGGNSSNFYIKAFQDYSEELAKKLYEVLQNDSQNKKYVVGIPYPIRDTTDYSGLDKIFWRRFTILDIDRFNKILNPSVTYIDSCFTRFYLNHKNRDFKHYINLLRSIWDNLNICIVEGENSRLGVGNDLFNNAKDIKRILCPTTNAFNKYQDIIRAIQKCPKFDLYLLALGHTATVMAYELSSLGLWAIDIGHIDIEYEWYLRKANAKEAIPNKYVNEIEDGRKLTACNDELYNSQIIEKVLN